MKLVIIESPYYSPDREEMGRNIDYALDCLRDSLGRNEAPFASHLLYTRVLDDSKVTERRLGLSAALRWIPQASSTAVYIDRGVSAGMRIGIQHAAYTAVQIRSIRGDLAAVHRIQAAYERQHSWLETAQCAESRHVLDTPILDSLRKVVGWRCGCRTVTSGPETLP